MESSEKSKCCSKGQCHNKNSDLNDVNSDDSETIAMYATGAILITGFLLVAFVSGTAGLLTTIGLLSLLGLYYALNSKGCGK